MPATRTPITSSSSRLVKLCSDPRQRLCTQAKYALRVDRHADNDYAIFGGEDCKTGQEENPQLVFTRLEAKLKTLLPQAEVQHRWLGQVIETNDGLPFIGESAPYRRRFAACASAGRTGSSAQGLSPMEGQLD